MAYNRSTLTKWQQQVMNAKRYETLRAQAEARQMPDHRQELATLVARYDGPIRKIKPVTDRRWVR